MSYMSNIPSKHGMQFIPKHKEKYKGDYPIQIRSSYEQKFAAWCDANDNIVHWTSESVEIPYFDPVKMKQRRYIPDFIIKVKDKTLKNDRVWLVEVKPLKECTQPVNTKGKSKKTKIYEATTYATNSAKWKAAIKYCKAKGWSFKIITERELFSK